MKNEGLISKYKVLEILYESYGLRDAEKRIANLRPVSYSENPNRCGDVIRRQMALDLCERFGGCVPYSVLSSHDMLPSVDTEKTGRWEWVQYDSNPNIGNWHCSECNRIVRGAITAASPVYSYKYCPSCGCFMKGDSDERS